MGREADTHSLGSVAVQLSAVKVNGGKVCQKFSTKRIVLCKSSLLCVCSGVFISVADQIAIAQHRSGIIWVAT